MRGVTPTFLDEAQLRLRPVFASAFAPLEVTQPPCDHASLVRALASLNIYPHLLSPSVRTLCVLREELAYRNPAADSVFAVQGLGSYPVQKAGTDSQKARFLDGVRDGKHLFAFALTEPEAGSDVASLTTAAVREGDSYVLRGHKRFISNAPVATHLTVFARTSPGTKGISAFVVPATAKALRIVPTELLGDHPVGEVHFDSVRVGSDALLGQEGDGLKLALGTLDVFRTTVGAAAVGMARRALDEALSYARTRKQFGAPLSELPAVQALLAESAVELEAASLLVHKAAAHKDFGQERVTYEAAVAKLFATEAAQRIIDRCLQIHGGQGVVRGHPLERLYRDVRALRIYEGASEVQRLVIARHLIAQEKRP